MRVLSAIETAEPRPEPAARKSGCADRRALARWYAGGQPG